MKLRIGFVLMIFLGLNAGSVQAQLTQLPSEAFFSEDSVKFGFHGPGEGARAGQLLSKWGIELQEGDSGLPTIRQVFVLAFPDNVVRNEHPMDPDESSADLPLVINFRNPAWKVGFNLGNLDSSTQVNITAYDTLGAVTGSLSTDGLAEGDFLGVRGPARGISKLVVTYGADTRPEQIDDLLVEFVSRKQFTTYVAQVGDGPISADTALQTSIIVSNLADSTATGVLLFLDSSGAPLTLEVNGEDGNQFDFTIPSQSSSTFVTSGQADPVGVGYARINADFPVEATALFRVISGGGDIVSEAGVGSSKGKLVAVGVVQKLANGSFNSGIAVVNTGDKNADVILEAHSQEGGVVATNQTLLDDFPPGNHEARFLNQIFPELADQEFDGTLVARSNVPVALVILRTNNGLVLSSLPVGSLED
jgi:hypothetical protein